MSGHLFVLQGDLTKLACDAWLLPTDADLTIEASWWKSSPWPVVDDLKDRVLAWAGANAQVQRVEEVADLRQVWLANVGESNSQVAPFKEKICTVAVKFLEEASRSLSGNDRYLKGRSCPLIALPALGTRLAGGHDYAGEILPTLLECIENWLINTTRSVDVALVAFTDESYAAAQAARRKRPHEARWDDLDEENRKLADALVQDASRGRLAVFLGAGVSAGANLPLWGSLLKELALKADSASAGSKLVEGGTLIRAFKELDLLDQAELLQKRLATTINSGDGGVSGLQKAIYEIVERSRAYSLAHGLLASLPVHEFITTNYDTHMEDALRGAKKNDDGAVAVLPWDLHAMNEDGSARPWLLKMHGCVTEEGRSSIVLSRESYLRYGVQNEALAGVVQAMLLTRHMLFIGFSMTDENFHKIADAVRRVAPLNETIHLGTVTTLDAEGSFELKRELWGDQLNWLQFRRREDKHIEDGKEILDFTRPARRLEIFLDYLACRTTTCTHLLQDRFKDGVDDSETTLRQHLTSLREGYETARAKGQQDEPGWKQVEVFLKGFGYKPRG